MLASLHTNYNKNHTHEFQLGNSSRKLFLISATRRVERFRMTVDEPGQLKIIPNDVNLTKYGVTAVLLRGLDLCGRSNRCEGCWKVNNVAVAMRALGPLCG
jgi:hypothetical protein